MTIDKLPLLQKESAGLHWVFVPRSQEAGIVPWRSFLSGCPGYWKSILSSSVALLSSATFVFMCTVRHVKAQLVIPGFASVTWGKARWEKYIYCKAFTWNGSCAPWFWIVWHLARSLQRVFRLREQQPALGLRGTLLVAGLGVPVLYVATPGSDVSVAWETEDAAGHVVDLKSALNSCWILNKTSGNLFAGWAGGMRQLGWAEGGEQSIAHPVVRECLEATNESHLPT